MPVPKERPIHLVPPGAHEYASADKVSDSVHFGGTVLLTFAQFREMNGFGTDFWGWGKEDDNLGMRARRAGFWPPKRPRIPAARGGNNGSTLLFTHVPHARAKDRDAENGPLIGDMHTGLHSQRYQLLRILPWNGAVKMTFEVHCSVARTPWCDKD